MGIARALLSFYGVPDSTTVKKDGQRTRIDGMTEAGFQKVANQRVQINVLTTLAYRTSPRRKKLQNTHVRQDRPAQTLRSPV
jgi:hypothetical protein